MNDQTQSLKHPTEEELMAYALHEGTPETGKHVQNCGDCARTVREFSEVGEKVASLALEEVPRSVEERVLELTRHSPAHGHQQAAKAGARWFGFGALLTNPVLISLLVILLLLGLYFLVGTEVFRQ